MDPGVPSLAGLKTHPLAGLPTVQILETPLDMLGRAIHGRPPPTAKYRKLTRRLPPNSHDQHSNTQAWGWRAMHNWHAPTAWGPLAGAVIEWPSYLGTYAINKARMRWLRQPPAVTERSSILPSLASYMGQHRPHVSAVASTEATYAVYD